MPQISRRKLNKTIENRMFDLFNRSLAGIKNNEGIGSYLDEVFTPTEKVMIAKRLAIAILLTRGWTQEAIRDILKVSTSTVQRLKSNLRFRGNGYRQVIKFLEDDDQAELMVKDMQETLARMFSGKVTQHLLVKGFPNSKRKGLL